MGSCGGSKVGSWGSRGKMVVRDLVVVGLEVRLCGSVAGGGHVVGMGLESWAGGAPAHP